MRRVASVLAGVTAVGMVVPFVVGIGPRTVALLPALGALGAVALVAVRRSAVVERGWSGVSWSPLPATAAPPDRGRSGHPPARRVARALSRVEAREMASSPWFGLGVGFLAMAYLLFAVVYPEDNASHWGEMVDLAPWLAHPLVGMVVLAAHWALTRPRRDGVQELFDSCPAGDEARTWGLLGAAWVPLGTLAAFLAVLGATVAVRSPNLYGAPGGDAVPQLLGAVLLGAGGVVLGVALGRWVGFALAPVVAVVAVGFLSMKLATAGDPGWNPLQQLSTFPPLSPDPPLFRDVPAWSHLGWIVSLTGAVLVLALARHRRDRSLAIAALAVCLLLTVTGVAATRPMPGDSAHRIASLVDRPADHQDCRATGPVQVCAYRGHDELLGRVVAEVEPVAALLPDAAAPITLRQRYEGSLDDLPPEVRRRLPGGVPPLPLDEVPLGYDVTRDELRVSRLRVGLQALGLPIEPDPGLRPVVIAGQARGVVALWLATRGLGSEAVREITSGTSARDLGGRRPEAFDGGYTWPAGCSTGPVVWSAQDLRAVRALAHLPEPIVRSVVHQGWERWREPATGTDELMAAAGIPPVGPFDSVQTRKVDPC